MNTIHCHRWLACVLCATSVTAHPDAAERAAPACISEFLADNQHGLKDDKGERSGWVEIYNAGSGTLSLAGWFLTDNRTNLTKWRFPGVSLLPAKYLVVFASGQDRGLDLGQLHTNFRLNPQGGYLALVDRATNIVSEFAVYPELAADTSYGRVAGELATVGRFLQPTPGKPNATRGTGFAPEVTFSPASGPITAPVSIQLSCGSSDAAIHYTLDGTLPSQRCRSIEAPLR